MLIAHDLIIFLTGSCSAGPRLPPAFVAIFDRLLLLTGYYCMSPSLNSTEYQCGKGKLSLTMFAFEPVTVFLYRAYLAISPKAITVQAEVARQRCVPWVNLHRPRCQRLVRPVHAAHLDRKLA